MAKSAFNFLIARKYQKGGDTFFISFLRITNSKFKKRVIGGEI